MKKAILAKKIGMTQVFDETGLLIPVTVLEAGPNVVVQKKTVENDGYNAIQVGFGSLRAKLTTKPVKGHFDKAGVEAKRFVKEFRLEETETYEVGAEIKADIFAAGEKVDVSGTSKGKGYQGAIKRHGQTRGPMSHGSKYHRGLGSMGSSASPSRVKKGKKMPGHMGDEAKTIQNLIIVSADAEKNLILIKGSVPGAKNSIVVIKDSVKA